MMARVRMGVHLVVILRLTSLGRLVRFLNGMTLLVEDKFIHIGADQVVPNQGQGNDAVVEETPEQHELVQRATAHQPKNHGQLEWEEQGEGEQ